MSTRGGDNGSAAAVPSRVEHPAPGAAPASTRAWWGLLLLLGVAALLLREYFVLVSVPQAPLRGDALEYFQYARNLIEHGVFSRAREGSAVIADAYRGPAYPLLLASAMLLAGAGWMALVWQVQALLGALACIVLAIWLRPALGTRWSVSAGFLLAFWPHHIAATGMLLVEVVFGLLLVLGLWLTSGLLREPSRPRAIAAGATFGAAALANPVALLLPCFLAIPLAARAGWRPAATMLLAFGFAVFAWEARSLTLDHDLRGASRAKINLVQGSWPSYHIAYASRNAHAEPRAIIAAIGEEEALIRRDTAAGLRAIAGRVMQRPGFFLRWYLLEKPLLLWDWDIRIGAGDVYVHPVLNSPLETHPLLRSSSRLLRTANPLLGVIAYLAAFALLVQGVRRRVDATGLAAAIGFLYLSAVHVVLQAEPRYATAYRALEIALLAIALAWLAGRARAWFGPSPSREIVRPGQ